LTPPLRIEIAGHILSLACDAQRVALDTAAVPRLFGVPSPASGARETTGRIYAGGIPNGWKAACARIRQGGTRLLTYEALQMTRLGDASFYEQGTLSAVFERGKNRLSVFAGEAPLRLDESLTNLFWTFVLWEVLAANGRFLLHAACLRSPAGKTVLFPANSRQGKSTLSIALARAGFHFLADDLVCLRPDGSLSALPRDLHIDPQLAEHFPELGFLRREKAYFALNPKRALSREKFASLYAARGSRLMDRAAKIDLVVFPQIQPVTSSVLTPLAKAEALTELIPPSALIFVEERQAKDHLDRLKAIVEGAACHRFVLGRDLYEQPARAAEWFGERAESTLYPGDIHASARL
jgi:hypothetical protein